MTVTSLAAVHELIEETIEDKNPVGVVYAYHRQGAPGKTLYAVFLTNQYVDIIDAPDVESYRCIYHAGEGGWLREHV